MDTHAEQKSGTELSEALAGGVRRRIMLLILCSTLTVALAFGLTFYYALVANQSAIARQVPELETVAVKLKSLLIMNTLVFVSILVASFYVLARIVTARMFQPLGLLQLNLATLASGKLPRPIEVSGEGAFAGLEDAMKTALAVIRDRERAELEKLTHGRESLGSAPSREAVREAIEEMIATKSAFLGMAKQEPAPKREELVEDSVFIKPR